MASSILNEGNAVKCHIEDNPQGEIGTDLFKVKRLETQIDWADGSLIFDYTGYG